MKEIRDIILLNPDNSDKDSTYLGRIIVENGIFEGYVKDDNTKEETIVFGTISDGEFIELILAEKDEEKLPIAYKVVLNNPKDVTSSIGGHNYPIAEYNGVSLYKTAYYEYETGSCKLKTLDPYFYCSTEDEDFEIIEKRIYANINTVNKDTKELYRTIIEKEKNKQKKKINKHNI